MKLKLLPVHLNLWSEGGKNFETLLLSFFITFCCDKLSFHPYEAGFYKPAVLKSPFAGLQLTQQCQVNFYSVFASML
jgi:hypothetical protein